MNLLTKDVMRKYQLDILNEVHDFCKDNNITYYLCYGTLLGAIRHNGYIPWDDDIDICMPRLDYNKFMKLFNQNNKELYFFCYENNTDFLYGFGKVSNKSTVIKERDISLDNIDLGINIDVFPLDGVNGANIPIHIFFLRLLFEIKSRKYKRERKIYKNIILLIGKFFLFPISKSFLLRLRLRLSKKYLYEDSSYVGCVSTASELRAIPKEYFNKRVLKSFEGKDYFIPEKYDDYLKIVYGDYMVLPSEEKRITHGLTAYAK